METIPSWFVIVMGLGTVFIGLISVILLCKILGAVCSLTAQKNDAAIPSPAIPSAPVAASPAVSNALAFANRQEVIAAISAAIAEECGTDTNAIRIVSIKKI